MSRRAWNKVLFSHSFCLYVSNFSHSDWSRTQNANKRADWLTLFALVYLLRITPGFQPFMRLRFTICIPCLLEYCTIARCRHFQVSLSAWAGVLFWFAGVQSSWVLRIMLESTNRTKQFLGPWRTMFLTENVGVGKSCGYRTWVRFTIHT